MEEAPVAEGLASVAPAGRPWRRYVGLALAVLLLWFVAQKVPWRDSLSVGEVTWTGALQGDFDRDEVRFRFDAGQGVPADSPLAGHPAASAVRLGGEVLARADGLESAEWVATASGPPRAQGEPQPLALPPGVRVEWRPGMPRALAGVEARALAGALGALFVATLLIATRWWRLLALSLCPTRWIGAVRLTYVGLFFNIALPGTNGGDLARALLVVRGNPGRRAPALSSVLVDRILGLLAMALVAGLAVVLADERLRRLELPVAAAVVLLGLGLAAFLNPGLRRLVHFDALLGRLPQGERLLRLDRALREYARHPGEVLIAVLLSSGNHLLNAVAVTFIGRSLGLPFGYLEFLCVVSVSNTLSAIPLSPGGLGVGEVLFGTLFAMLADGDVGDLGGVGGAGGAYMLGVATSIVYRLCLWALGLAGGLFLILPGGREVREQFARQRGGEPSD